MNNGQWTVDNETKPVRDKSFAFALRTVKLFQFLCKTKGEFVLSKQMLRAGTAIGALVREAEHAESKADFVHKMAIALKEANETQYWLDVLHQSGHLERKGYESIHPDVVELLKLLTSIIKSAKSQASVKRQ
jgi:four helix bundle protein